MAKTNIKIPGNSPGAFVKTVIYCLDNSSDLIKNIRISESLNIIPLKISDFDTSMDFDDLLKYNPLILPGAIGNALNVATGAKTKAYQSALDNKKEIDDFYTKLHEAVLGINAVLKKEASQIDDFSKELFKLGKTLDDWNSSTIDESSINTEILASIQSNLVQHTVNTVNEISDENVILGAVSIPAVSNIANHFGTAAAMGTPLTWAQIQAAHQSSGSSNNNGNSNSNGNHNNNNGNGNHNNNSSNGHNSSGTGSGAAAATGATVVAASSGTSSSSGKSKKKSKKKSTAKSAVKNTLTTAAMIAATKKGLKSNIKQVKENASIQIQNAKTANTDKKRQLEIEKNNKIADINKQAAEDIESVDPASEDAQQKIDEIKANAEKEITDINDQYDKDIANLDEDLKSEISKIETERDNTVKQLNSDLDKLKSEKVSDKAKGAVVEQKLSGTAKTAAVTATAAATKESDVTASQDNMKNATGELSDKYEDKSYSIQNPTQSDTDGDSENLDTGNQNTPAQDSDSNNTNTEVNSEPEESVASPQTSNTESSNNDDYTPTSSSSNNNYTASDETSEDIVPTITNTSTSTDTGVDQSNADIVPEISDESVSASSDEVSVIGGDTSEKTTSKGSGLGAVIPIGLGVAATGAAAVAGVRYMKNKKSNEDIDENYDDESNDSTDGYEDVPSDSAYMQDDYLGPEGSTYTEVPDENSYTDAEELEEAAGTNEFSEDTALDDLN